MIAAVLMMVLVLYHNGIDQYWLYDSSSTHDEVLVLYHNGIDQYWLYDSSSTHDEVLESCMTCLHTYNK